MKKALEVPPKITSEERQKLDRCFYLPDWQFETLIEKNCTVISSQIITWENSVYAHIYGLRAVFSDTGKPCFGNFFVRHLSQVYQCREIEQAVEMVELIKKDTVYSDYEDALWKLKQKERQKKKSKLLKAA